MKTEQEKIAMCTLFLERRGYTVFSEYMTGVQIARLIGVASQTVFSWHNLNGHNFKPDFPKPLSVRGSANSARFLAKEVLAWAEKHCDVVLD